MNQNTHNEEILVHLMEQYKLYVEMADRISVRRGQSNAFFISLLSVLLTLLSFFIDNDFLSGYKNISFLFTSLLGLALCLAWFVNIQSYKELNSLKFKVINEMESLLPFECFKREWEILSERKKKGGANYIRLTFVEKMIPIIFSLPYLGLFIYSLVSIV